MIFFVLVSTIAIVEAGGYEALSFRDVKDLLILLKRDDVQTELGMTSAQAQAGRETERRRKMRKEHNRLFPTLTLAERERGLHRILLDEYTSINESLSPDQQQRLQELLVQYQALSHGTPELLESVVDLTAEQKAEIKKREAAQREQLSEMMWTFHRHSQRELSQLMTPEQRGVWRKTVGEQFEFEEARGLSILGTLR